jgi:hypothetical protein
MTDWVDAGETSNSRNSRKPSRAWILDPSQTMRGRTARAAIGSAHFTRQMSLIASPAKAMSERQAHSAD